MADYFKGQTNLRIEVETNVDLTAATLLIKYKKPNGAEGSFVAIINGSDDSKMYYDIVDADDLDVAGNWVFWSHVVYSDGTVSKGKSAIQRIKAEGEV